MKERTKRRIAAAVGITAFVLAAALASYLFYCQRAVKTEPSPNATSESIVDSEDANDGFPVVDWDYWLSINPDIIGWITIPETNVNSPIIQAHSDDPYHWLHYDVYGNYNYLGAIYLDAECEEYGLSSRNAVILGHHIKNNPDSAPFGILAEYSNYSFAQEHALVLIQTPNTKMKYQVRFTQIVPGWEPIKRINFESEQDWELWYNTCLEDAAMVLDKETEPEQIISLVTCSYNFWTQNERTVVVTSEELASDNIIAKESEALP